MKNRTIEDIHDKEIGNKKFAWFVDTVIKEGHTITKIKEFNERFKFELDGYPMSFDKVPSINAKWQLEQCYKLLSYYEKLKSFKR